MEIHQAARRHAISDADIVHAAEHPVVVVDVEPDADPPKVLVIGPDTAGNLLEIVVLTLAGGRRIAIHAMRLRRRYQALLPRVEDDHG